MTEQRKSNCMRIYKYMQKNGSITDRESRMKLNVGYVAQRIYDLKKFFNKDINSTLITSNNERYSVYTIN